MARIDEFNPVENAPGSSKPGLKRHLGSKSQVIIKGDALDGLTLYVMFRGNTTPAWQGALAKDIVNNHWYTDLQRGSSSTEEDNGADVGVGEGGPEDVPITVSAGTSVTAPVATKDVTVTVG